MKQRPTWQRWLTYGGGSLVALSLLVLGYTYLPTLAISSLATGLDESERASLLTEERRNFLALTAGLLGGLTILYTHRRQELTKDENRTSRYTQAVQLLGSTTHAEQLGAIYALQRLARDSSSDRSAICNLLCAFVRDHSRSILEEEELLGDVSQTNEHIVAAAQVVGDKELFAEITKDLHGAMLYEARFKNADWSRANLSHASFVNSTLVACSFDGAELGKTRFESARLDNCHLGDSWLIRTDFRAATLHETRLPKSWAGPIQLDNACLDARDEETIANATPAQYVGTPHCMDEGSQSVR